MLLKIGNNVRQSNENSTSAPSIDGLHIDFNKSDNWTQLAELYVLNTTDTEKFNNQSLTAKGEAFNSFGDISDNEYTSDSSQGADLTVAKIDDQVISGGGGENSTDASTELNIYIKWSSSFDLKTIRIWLLNTVTYGFPSGVVFKDRSGTTLTPTASPADIDDYIDIDGIYREYEWSFD